MFRSNLRFVDVQEELALGGQPEEPKGPLLPKDQVSHRVPHDGSMSDPSEGHVEVLLQHSVDLPALDLDVVIVLKLPTNLFGTANVVGAKDHLLDHLLDGCSSIAFSYVL